MAKTAKNGVVLDTISNVQPWRYKEKEIQLYNPHCYCYRFGVPLRLERDSVKSSFHWIFYFFVGIFDDRVRFSCFKISFHALTNSYYPQVFVSTNEHWF